MSLPLKTIVIIAIVVIVLLSIVGFFVIKSGQLIISVSECENKGGKCSYDCSSGMKGIFKCGDYVVEDTQEGKSYTVSDSYPQCCMSN